jgi:SAM-dependent methyltransferase
MWEWSGPDARLGDGSQCGTRILARVLVLLICKTAAAINVAEHPHYAHYRAEQIERLDGFFGRVDESFNRRIAQRVIGSSVLDYGCGFGSIVEYLRRRGTDAVGIDLLESQVRAGHERFPNARLTRVQGGPLPFDDDSFDTVIFKDSLHHVAAESADVDADIAEVARVCTQRVIVFDPNPTPLVRLARALIRHVDPTLSVGATQALLEGAGFSVKSVQFLASLAFPLSGGYVGKRLVPANAPSAIIRLDDHLVRLLGRGVAWRYLLVADKKQPERNGA